MNNRNNAYSVVYVTSDYSQFKYLEGNRPVEKYRKKRIEDSIAKVGYILNPITVNERMEVIDGQARLAVLREKEMPVYFVIAEGAGVEECRQLNIGQANWRTIDYINSYADEGNENYIRLRDVIKVYTKKGVTSDCVCGAAENAIISTGSHTKRVKDGLLIFPEKDINPVCDSLNYVSEHLAGLNGIVGNNRSKHTAIAWAVRNTSIDRKRLGNIIDKKYPLSCS